MKIYLIKPDFDFYSLDPKDQEFWSNRNLFSGEAIDSDWPAPVAFQPKNVATGRPGDFMHLSSAAMVFTQAVLESPLGRIIRDAGEVFNVTVDSIDDPCFVLNTLACYNCIDRENLKARTTPDGKIVIQIHEYAFDSGSFGESNLFKVPETQRNCIYCASTEQGEGGFMEIYKNEGFTGLIFEEIWLDETLS